MSARRELTVLGRSVGLKKKKLKKKDCKWSRNRRPGTPPTAETPMRQKNGSKTSLFIFYFLLFLFFLKMPENWVGRTTLNEKKKGDGLNVVGFWKTSCLARVARKQTAAAFVVLYE